MKTKAPDKSRPPERAAILSHLKDEIARAKEIQEAVWRTASFLEKIWPGFFEEMASFDQELRDLTNAPEYQYAQAADKAARSNVAPPHPPEVVRFTPKTKSKS